MPTETPTRVLVADDDPVTRRLLEVTLTSWGYAVQLATNGDEALAALTAEDGATLAIVDWVMPGLHGPELCRRVRERNAERYVYLVLLTAKSDRQHIIEGMEAGADDYLAKPFDQHELRVRLRAGRRVLELEEALRFRATHDALTGLLARGAILDGLERELARTIREKTGLGIALVDLDHFKNINDTYGHLAGDAVLQEAARRMQACLRPYDSVGRYGGEEILVVLPSCDEAGLRRAAERVRSALSDAPVQYGDQAIAMSASVGIALHPASGMPGSSTALLRAADQAMYRAKAAGRNRVELAF